MNLNKSIRRQKQRFKKQHGMQITGRSVFVIVEVAVKKSKKKKRGK